MAIQIKDHKAGLTSERTCCIKYCSKLKALKLFNYARDIAVSLLKSELLSRRAC